MQETFFTTSVIMGFFNLMKELGFLGFIAGGLAVFAFGYGYTKCILTLQFQNTETGVL